MHSTYQRSSELFETPTSGYGDQWFVLRTKSRQEKILSQELTAMHVAHFLPIVNVTRYYGGRKAAVEIPLFAGYLFLRGNRDQAFEADRTRRVAQIIDVGNQECINRELKNIAFALSRSAVLDIFPYLKKGVRVEVRSGPLRGLEGIVEDRNRRDRIILKVEILGSAVSVEVDAASVDVVE